MDQVVLTVENLKKTFSSKQIHRRVSFKLQRNEILALLGGSGTGKSLILRSIIGLEHPDEGRILYHGQDLTRLSESELSSIRTRISYVFQNGALFDSNTVFDNLAYPLREHTQLSEKDISHKIMEMLKLINMEGAENLLPAELSGGMQKRVGLARSIILGPEVVLFDEPTAGLDPENTKRIVRIIQQFKQRGLTGIFVTHDIPAAFQVAERIAILHQGEILTIDTPENLKRSDNPIVKSFLEEWQ